jgi:hypothetical protein
MQKNGAGMNTAATMYWDGAKVHSLLILYRINNDLYCLLATCHQDGKAVVNWSNKTMHVLVTVYGLAINVENPSELE